MELDPGFTRADSRNLPKVNTEAMFLFINQSDLYIQAESRGVKTTRAGREEYADDAIGYVQVKWEGKTCTIRARICPEHKIKSKPYSVEAVIIYDDEEEITIERLSCKDCTASSGGCKHSHALLSWLHRRSEEKPCTSVPCYWKKPTLSSVGKVARTAAQLMSTRKKKRRMNSSPAETGGFFDEFISKARKYSPNCQIMMHFSPLHVTKQLSMHALSKEFRETGQETADDFLKFCSLRYSDSLMEEISVSTEMQSSTPHWYHIKYGRWSGSTAYECAHCKTPGGSLVEKILGAQHTATAEMRRGLNIEKSVLDFVSKKLNCTIHRSGFLLEKHIPEGGCSPDGVSTEAVFEVKCPSKISCRKYYVDSNGKLKPKIYSQLQIEMLFAKKSKGYLCLASPSFERDNAVDLFEVEFDDVFVCELVSKCTEFWKDYIFSILLN